MRLRANVRRRTGVTRHVIHGRESEDLTSQIAWVEIEPADGAFYLFYFTAAGECITDSWHESLEQAKHQAFAEFEILDADWMET
jgi:hypothetical protein